MDGATPFVAAAIAATLLFGLAAVLLKVGVSRGIPSITASELVRDLGRVVRVMLRNRIWLAGLGVNVVGGLFYFVALARLDLTIVKPIITFYVVVAALAGALVLEERVSRVEILGIATAVVGAALLGVHGEAMTGDAVPIDVQVRGMWLVLAGAVVLSAAVVAPRWFAPRLLSSEVSLSLISGIYWGLGAAWYKLFFNQIAASHAVADGLIQAALTGTLWVEVLSSTALWLMLGLNVFGFAVYQVAFAHGRVAVIAPVVMAATLVAPLFAGFYVYGEDLPALKLAGILTAAVGTVILAAGSGDGDHPTP